MEVHIEKGTVTTTQKVARWVIESTFEGDSRPPHPPPPPRPFKGRGTLLKSTAESGEGTRVGGKPV